MVLYPLYEYAEYSRHGGRALREGASLARRTRQFLLWSLDALEPTFYDGTYAGVSMKREFVINRQGKDYVLYAGLLDEAHQQGLKEIKTQLVQAPTAQNGQVAICFAEVTTEKGTFTGIGDADPGNVNRMMATALIRLAETRSKARALRDAVNVGMVAIEELAESASESLAVDDAGLPDVLEPPASIVSFASARQSARQAPAAHPGDAGIAETPLQRGSPTRPARPGVEPADAESPAEAPSHSQSAPSSGARANGSKPPADPTPLPATQTQLETIAKLARSIGRTVNTNDLTRATASELITRLSEERYGARR